MEHDVIEQIAAEVRRRLEGEGSGHDWFHVERVARLAEYIGRAEHADLEIIRIMALMHDIADWKFTGSEASGPNEARKLLEQYRVPETTIEVICDAVATISFKGADVATPMKTLEGKCVQDADRLDALGAIGIARTFAYGGFKKRTMYDPTRPPAHHATKEEYMAGDGTTINHFYEKLLLLKDRMNTETGRRIAHARHKFMEMFLKEFFAEWNGDN